MSHFDQLHPALQHHIVNSLGWRELRPFQDAAIPPIIAGQHQIVVAPTAGGKTEAVLFPVVSRMLSENWRGLSVLYICPTKALLNNLDLRLERYCTLLGRRSAIWHGDVGQSDRRRIRRDPPDCLLTTPESLEAMLVSSHIDTSRLFADLRTIIVDEVHAFAGDDRGWHLLAVLERITRLSGREVQRIGLSATVGNPDQLLEWLAGSCRGERGVLRPTGAAPEAPEVQVDYVGSLSNAAKVISQLHLGEKRLVFVDSRAEAEELGVLLKKLDVTTFVTHSSLSQEERRQAEEAFVQRENCVIVATSVLELGVDVGNLDRIIQIDSPMAVASFLQRMGRTGRRPGSVRNCLFLSLDEPSLLQATALVDLAEQGYVEAIRPPVEPYHVLAQQLMALTLQETGIGQDLWKSWISGISAFARMPDEEVRQIVEWMLQHEILWSEEGILAIAREGEETFGRRHFLELLSVFTSPPLFTVLCGRRELGFVDESTFMGKRDSTSVLLLGGRAWRVQHVDWSRRVAYVEPSDDPGRSRWKSGGRGLSFSVAQAIKRVLIDREDRAFWTDRARHRIEEIRLQREGLTPSESVVVHNGANISWWTFAGEGTNASLASGLSDLIETAVTYDGFALRFGHGVSLPAVQQGLNDLRTRTPESLLPRIDEAAIYGLKFSECLPTEIARRMLQRRLQDVDGVKCILQQDVSVVESHDDPD